MDGYDDTPPDTYNTLSPITHRLYVRSRTYTRINVYTHVGAHSLSAARLGSAASSSSSEMPRMPERSPVGLSRERGGIILEHATTPDDAHTHTHTHPQINRSPMSKAAVTASDSRGIA